MYSSTACAQLSRCSFPFQPFCAAPANTTSNFAQKKGVVSFPFYMLFFPINLEIRLFNMDVI